MDQEARRNAMARLRRAAGQVEGIRRMLEEERHISDILIQIAAVRAALARVAALSLEAHLRRGIDHAATTDDDGARERAIADLVDAFRRYCSA